MSKPSAELLLGVILANDGTTIEKTISCFERTREHRGQAVFTVTIAPTKLLSEPARPDAFPLHNVR